MSHARRYRVTGRVQGVGFRAATSHEARELGLAGWVGNCSDGAVELAASGPEDALDSLRAWLNHGPAMARVDGVDETAASGDELTTPFSVV